jgi:isoquinoline 1-oxidoreductase beta subunit
MGKWTRRAFIGTGIVAGGALVVGVAIRPGNRGARVAPLVGGADDTVVTAWVKIGADNSVTAIVPHAEMGQGAHSSLAMMLADELDADWNTVRVLEAPAHEEYANHYLAKGFALGEAQIPRVLVGTVDGAFLKITQGMDLQITGGSTSVRLTGQHGMRVAGAAARAILLEAAADSWHVPMEELSTANSVIHHRASERSAPYADFAAAAAELTPPYKPRLKDAAEFTVMGRSLPRLDIPSKTDGSALFGIDATLPGMKHAAIRAAPVFGGTVVGYDETALEGVTGIHRIVNLGTAVAVVADSYWQAQRALNSLDIQFDSQGLETVEQGDIFRQFGADMDRTIEAGEQQTDVRRGDTHLALANAARIVEAEYRVPYLAHATMEPMNCTAWVHDGVCEAWTGTQNPLGFRAAIAEALGLEKNRVTVTNLYLGGGFGRRSDPDYAVQAARIAAEVDYPVKLIWSREEDTQHDHYRPAVLSRFRGGLDESGRPVAWENQFVDKRDPAEASHIPYDIANQFIHFADSKTHIPWGPWRSVDHTQHGFFTESFIDELAHAAQADPWEFRRRLLSGSPRELAVLDLAAQKAGWHEPLPKGRGRGIALQRSFNSIVAQVVEVTVNNGKLSVDRVVCAVDAGFAITPDGLIAQMESGIIYGLTAALYGEITIRRGAVAQGNFHDYKMLRYDESPLIETHIINSGEALGGAGEPGTPALAPALANAIFAATGKRIRDLPVKNHDLGDTSAEARDIA